jgi:hypothetical protein
MTTITAESILTKKQVKTFTKTLPEKFQKITAEVRYDDECGNGHNSFAITATIWKTDIKLNAVRWEMGGCCHDEIKAAFPELAPFIKWHLCSSDGPLHYVANTVYHASDRDYRGLLKGEKRQLRNGRTNLPVWERVITDAAGRKVKIGNADWRDAEQKPEESLIATWEPVWIIGEGKARELDFARSSAVWPEATDEDLTAPGLKERLEARLPALMVEFRQAVEFLGFVW